MKAADLGPKTLGPKTTRPELSGPEMSVVLASPDNYETIATTLSYLRAQTARKQMEIIIVAPSASEFGYDFSGDADFFDVRIVEVGTFDSLPRSRAMGVRAAAAPVVTIAEDHCYPTPTWAAALIKAHQQPWAAVGPVMGNANPDSAASWAQLYLTYGQWVAPHPGGIVEDLPGHNSSYKRALLLDYGPEMERIMETETILHADLRAKGHQLFLNPDALVHHINMTRPATLVKDHMGYNRMIAAEQSQGWGRGARLIGAVKGAALIPLHLWRVIRLARRTTPSQRPLPEMLPVLAFGAVLHGIGDVLGFLTGPGRGVEHHWEHEFHRERFVAPSDWPRLAPCPAAPAADELLVPADAAMIA